MNLKFDIEKEKKLLPIICTNKEGAKIRNLRIENKLTLKELSEKIGINVTTLRHVEVGKIKVPYYYWKLTCDYFGVNHIRYLELYNMKEKTYSDKLWKMRAYLGARTWEDVAEYLGYSSGYISDLLTRYTPNSSLIDKLDRTLEKLK